MPHQPVYPDKVVERCGRLGNKWDLTLDAPLPIYTGVINVRINSFYPVWPCF